MAGPLAGALLGSAVGGTVGPLISSATSPVTRAATAEFNAAQPNVRPPADLIFHGLIRGLISPDVGVSLLREQGIAANVGNRRRDPLADAWLRLAENMLTVPDVSLAMNSLARNLITPAQAGEMMRRAGADVSKWTTHLKAFWAAPSVGMLMEARTRELISEFEFDDYLKRLSFGQPTDRWMIDRLRENLPPISDLIRFQVREVFDPVLGNRLGLYDEFPAAIEPWFRKLGYTTDFGLQVQSDGAQRPLNTVLAEWAAHWQPISPGQSYEMLHRLRPGRVNHYNQQLQALTGVNPGLQAFTMEDVRFWLRISDYPKGIRDYLSAIAFNPLRLIDIRNALILHERIARNPNLAARVGPQVAAQFGATDRAWAVDQLLDRGLAPADAETSADLAIAGARAEIDAPLRAIERGVAGTAVKDIVDSYRIGIVERPAAEAQLIATGLEPRAVGILLNHAQIERQKDVIRSGLRRIRSEFIRGLMTEGDARRNLIQLGLAQTRRDELIDSWKLLSTPGIRRATTSQLLSWAREGIINRQELETRLQGLNWENFATLSFLQETEGKIAKTQAGILASAERNRATAAKQLEKLANQVARQQKEIRAELRRLTPVTTLQVWLKKGIINGDYFRRRMSAMGYTPDLIVRYEEAIRNGQQREPVTQESREAEETEEPGTEAAP